MSRQEPRGSLLERMYRRLGPRYARVAVAAVPQLALLGSALGIGLLLATLPAVSAPYSCRQYDVAS